MPTHAQYTVQQRLSDLTSRVTTLEKENANLRTHLAGALQTAVNDAKNTIQSSIKIPVDGRDGVDGESIVGPRGERGERGDVLIPNETELQQAVIALRRKLLEQRAAFLAVINQRIAENNTSNKIQQHFANLLEYVKKDIERLQ